MAQLDKVEVPHFPDILNRVDVGVNLTVGLNSRKQVGAIFVNGKMIRVPTEEFDTPEGFRAFTVDAGPEKVHVVDFTSHPMNLHNRWKESKPEDEEKRAQLIRAPQDRIIVSIGGDEGVAGYILPKVFEGGEAVSRVSLVYKNTDTRYNIRMWEFQEGVLTEIEAQEPLPDAKILHGTQIIGHVKDGCDMQVEANEKGTLQDNWRFAFPPTARTWVNQKEAAEKGVPTYDVTRSWSYTGGKEGLRSNFHSPESFASVMGFVAANAELCLDVAKGRYGVISTNFRSEGQLLQFINPNIVLGGINFTFLNGRPGERVSAHPDLPKLGQMLQRVQKSLDGAADRVAQLGIPKEWSDDWWRISVEKINGIDFLLFRTFSFDDTLPTEINGMKIIQIPHPIPELQTSKSEAREYLESVIGMQLQNEDKVVLLPGTSEDGGTQKRISEVITMAKDNPHVIVITPMKSDDSRLAGFDLPSNVYPIGFRDDWMNIISAGDVTFLRGSWGEILDTIAAGNIPIITSPGTVPQDKSLGETQFLTEVSGERATNLSLLVKELQKNGVSTQTIQGLLADTLKEDAHDEVTSALNHALRPEVAREVRDALSRIPRGGIPWVVDIHEMILDKRRNLTNAEIDRLHAKIWNTNDRMRRS